MALLRNDSPAIICSRLKESLSRYEAAVKGVDKTYLRLEEEQEDERTYQEWVAKHSEYLKPKEDKIAEVVNRISEWEAAAYAAHAQASFNKSAAAGIPAVGAERQPRHQDQSRGHRLAGSLPDQT